MEHNYPTSGHISSNKQEVDGSWPGFGDFMIHDDGGIEENKFSSLYTVLLHLSVLWDSIAIWMQSNPLSPGEKYMNSEELNINK